MFSDRTYIKFNIKDYQRLFIMGAVFGGLIFMLIYGIAVLNPAYTAWIYYGDYDLKQHFMGWCHYRNSEWKFPIGLIDTLSYPISISTIYTDSIPGVALLFKLISAVLPAEFQYYGLVGILFYMLNGGTAVILLKRFIRSPWVCLLCSPLFIVSFPIIQRMYYHTALAAQWIIFLSFIIWAYDSYPEKVTKSVLHWGLMGFICVSIHSYFLPMAGMIMLSDRICYYMRSSDDDRASASIPSRLLKSVLPMISFCLTALISLWIFGGFYGPSSGVGEGLGTFTANLNTFINPGEYGALLPQMGYENYFQYEGCGYLGLGIILLSIFVDVMLVIKWKKGEIKNTLSCTKNKRYVLVLLGLFVVSFLISTLPVITFGTHNLGTIPLPGIVFRIASVFRSNGRFIWVAMYIIMLVTVIAAVRFLQEMSLQSGRQKLIYAVLFIVLVIQTSDLWKMISEKHNVFARDDYSYTTMWDSDEVLSDMAAGKSHFEFLYAENDINMETAFYAYKHNMTLNSFYFARDIEESVNDNIDIYMDELQNGMVRSDTVYIAKPEDYKTFKDNLDSANVNIYEMGVHVIFTARK